MVHHTPSHDDYVDKLHRLAEHIKAHPEEARAGVAKLSEAAQKPAGEIIKIFVSDKDAKTKYEECAAIKAALPAAVRAEIENHKAELAHKIGILTLAEILDRLEKLAAHIKAHPAEAKERVLKLSAAAQKPAGDILKVFCSDKTPKEKYEECQAIRATLSSEVIGEIDAHKEEIAKRLGLVPLHHLAHTHAHSDYADKLHRLAEHIKAHPEEARAGVAKLSTAAQKPAGEIIKIFVSDKTPKEKYEEVKKVKAGLAPAVVAEIENHKTELAHKIGILTLPEIVERLEKLAEHIKAHPEEARAGVAKLSAAAQKPAGDIIKIFVSDKDAKTKYAECKAIKDSLPSDVLGEINAVKDTIAKRIGIAPVHHLGAHTHSHDEYADKLHRLAVHIRAHPDEARANISKLSTAAQQPAGEIVKIFCSDKDAKVKYEEIKAIKAALPAAVRAEIENNTAELAHKIGILTLHEILDRLEKLAEHIRAHPEEAKAGVLKLSPAAQLPAHDLLKVFCSDKDVKTKYAECQAIKARLTSEVLGEINAHKEEIAIKIGIAPLHTLAMTHTHSHDDYVYRLHRLSDHIRAHPEETRERVLKLSAAAQQPAGEIIKIFVSDKDAHTKYEEIEKIKAGLPAAVRAEIENHKAELAHKIGLLTLHEIVARLEKLADHIRAHPEEARAGVAKLSAAAQKPAGEIIKIFCSDKTPKEKFAECKAIKDTLSSEVLGEINAHKEEIAHKIGVTPLHYH